MATSLKERIRRQKKKKETANKYFVETNSLFDDLFAEIIQWREISNCNDPNSLQRKLEKMESNLDNNLEDEIKAWKKATNCKTPQEAQEVFVALQDDDKRAMYNDEICKMYMWEFDKKTFVATKALTTVDDFYFAMSEMAEEIYSNQDHYIDPYNMIGFFKYLYDQGYHTCKGYNHSTIDIKKICEVILDDR